MLLLSSACPVHYSMQKKDMRKCQRHAEPSSFRGSAREWACAALAPTFEEQERHR